MHQLRFRFIAAPVLAFLMIAGATISRFDVAAPRWLISLPLVWFAWQLAAATHTADAGLTRATLLHFGARISLGCEPSSGSTETSQWISPMPP